MPRSPARFTQADLARAIRAAEACGKTVRVLRDGSFEIVEKEADTTPAKPVEASQRITL